MVCYLYCWPELGLIKTNVNRYGDKVGRNVSAKKNRKKEDVRYTHEHSEEEEA